MCYPLKIKSVIIWPGAHGMVYSIVLVFYSPLTYFRSFQVQSVNLASLSVPGQAS